jgi:hypothetical protein
MSSESHRTPPNAFTRDFLSRLDQIAEPDGAHEADVAGPWIIRPVPYQGGTGFALMREWESLKSDRRPDGADARDRRPHRGDGSHGSGGPHGSDIPADDGTNGATGDDIPYAVFRRRDTALLAAAVLPATGRERLCRLSSEPDPEGFPMQIAATPDAGAPGSAPAPAASRAPAPAGHLRDFDEDLAAALHVVEALVRSPVALARLIEAAGYVAIEQAGRILHRRIH